MATTGINYNREVRRRRIIDRGSDRLALITGRIHSIPSTPEQQDQLSSGNPKFTFSNIFIYLRVCVVDEFEFLLDDLV